MRRAARTVRYFVAYNLVMMVGLLPIFPAFYILAHMDALWVIPSAAARTSL